ncbi:transcriptional repressor [Ammonicoccus fulvus]|uniref:Transcriptional repressor n=1 Tax=Ammonicoccus fulvus TaxID=3138240 RepID=A0ABZ3FM64_9ACTN
MTTRSGAPAQPSERSGAPAQPGTRRTKQRAAISALLADVDDFRTAQQIHDLLREGGESVGLATVYRTLQAMAAAEEVDVIRHEGEQLFRRCHSSEHHHHLVCRSCGHTIEITGPGVTEWAARLGQQHGFRDIDHELELFGLCDKC